MTEKVDIFSLGFVYFSLISGGLPFREDIVGIPDLDPTWHLGYTEVTGNNPSHTCVLHTALQQQNLFLL